MEAWAGTLAGVGRLVAVRNKEHLAVPPSPADVAVDSWDEHCMTL